MNHKLVVKIAIIMAVVFGITVVVYPLIFSPKASTPVEAVPAPAPVGQ